MQEHLFTLSRSLKIFGFNTEAKYIDKLAASRQEIKGIRSGLIPRNLITDAFLRKYFNKRTISDDEYLSFADAGNVVFGNKPAAIVENYAAYPELYNEMFRYMNPNYVTSWAPSLSKYNMMIIGEPERVKTLVRIYIKYAYPNKKPDRDFHSTVGESLGFSQEDIDEFLNNQVPPPTEDEVIE